jgi:prepilin-type N-terminal cleavage/methylation domain-containing protein
MGRRRLIGPPGGPLSNQAGFTLVELLVSMILGLLLLGAVMEAFSSQDKAYRTQDQITGLQQGVRAAADLVVDDVRMAGYGLPDTGVGSWVTWVAMTANPEITDGAAGAPDTVSVAAAFEPPVGSLLAPVVPGATLVQLGAGEGTAFNTSDRSVLYLGRNESALVTGVAGDVLTIDTDPATGGNQGLTVGYPAGAPVEAVSVVTYRLVGTTLMRDENRGDGDQPVVDAIEDLQLTRAGSTVTVRLTGRTAKEDFDYTHPVEGDGYRRLTYAPSVNLRNL